jgi:uncharacterized protein YlxW (UPF0749 family)
MPRVTLFIALVLVCVLLVLALSAVSQAQSPQPSTLDQEEIRRLQAAELERLQKAQRRLEQTLKDLRKDLSKLQPLFCEVFRDGRWIPTSCWE